MSKESFFLTDDCIRTRLYWLKLLWLIISFAHLHISSTMCGWHSILNGKLKLKQRLCCVMMSKSGNFWGRNFQFSFSSSTSHGCLFYSPKNRRFFYQEMKISLIRWRRYLINFDLNLCDFLWLSRWFFIKEKESERFCCHILMKKNCFETFVMIRHTISDNYLIKNEFFLISPHSCIAHLLTSVNNHSMWHFNLESIEISITMSLSRTLW